MLRAGLGTAAFAIKTTDHRYSVAIFNAVGQKVEELQNGQQASGTYTVTWDGRDGNGRDLPSGLYFYRIQTSNASVTKSVVLLK